MDINSSFAETGLIRVYVSEMEMCLDRLGGSCSWDVELEIRMVDEKEVDGSEVK